MLGFVYGDKHSNDFGIVAKSVSRPILPSLRKRELIIPSRHGTYDFGNNAYENRSISVLLQYIGNSFNELRIRARNIAAWLGNMTYATLTFDDEPDKYYLAKIYNALDLETLFRLGKATVQFECQPFALYQESSGVDLTWDTALPWGSEYTWNNVWHHAIAVTEDADFDIDYFGTQEVGLGSPAGSKFDIAVYGSFTDITISLNGKSITHTGPVLSQAVIIDNVNATVKNGSINELSKCIGNTDTFLSLIPGLNTVSITGTGLNCSVLFDFIPQYI